MGESGRRSFLAGGELALPFRVACVSRLIGRSDTTAKHPGWQVHSLSNWMRNLSMEPPGTRRKAETPPPEEWRFTVLHWSLASQASIGRWLFPPYLLQNSQ